MFRRIADRANRRPRRILAAALVVLALCGVFGGPVAGKLSGSPRNFEDSASESVRARRLLERSGVSPDVGVVVLVRTNVPVRSPAGRRRVERLARAVAADPAVARVADVFDTHDPAFVSTDGRATYLGVVLGPASEGAHERAAKSIQKRLASEPGVTVGGPLLAGVQVGKQVGADLGKAEGLVVPVILVLLFLVFRGLVAALLPLLGAVVAILGTFLVLRAVNAFAPLSIFALNLTTGLGLGLAIDYNLFIVSRYREELARGATPADALVRTVATAGRTAAFSGLTVAAALASLLVYPQPFLYSMGTGGIAVALFSVASALVVLPALLALLGPRVNALSPKRFQRSEALPQGRGFWYRVAHVVMRRPLSVAAVSAAVLLALGAPFLGIRFTGVDASVLPESASARQVQDAIHSRSPEHVVVDSRTTIDAIRHLPGVAATTAPRALGDGLWTADVTARARPMTAEAKQLDRRIRALPGASVGGVTAWYLDTSTSLRRHLPLAGAILALTVIVLLYLVTRSVVLPLKAIVMNAVSLCAAFGVLVWVFQDGRLEGLLHYQSQGALELTQPILLFAIAFGLATDYGVFLLSRIREAHESGLENREAVALGLERTGRVITAAALLFCVAVGSFATSEIVLVKEIGVGIALAVAIDASLVRALLVPSLMALLGDWNWWRPGRRPR
jgi:uncharacterized membrane protein YdfJ with MMPL/SSD domain